MNGVQHKQIGLAAGAALSGIIATPSIEGILFNIILAGAGSMIPDIDHNHTKLGRTRKNFIGLLYKLGIIVLALLICLIIGTKLELIKTNIEIKPVHYALVAGLITLYGLSYILSKLDVVKWSFKHRGITHTLLMPAALVIASIFFPFLTSIIIPITVGIISHIFADMLTIAGCPIFFPLSRVSITLVPGDKIGKDMPEDNRVKKKKKVQTKVMIRCWIVTLVLIVIFVLKSPLLGGKVVELIKGF